MRAEQVKCLTRSLMSCTIEGSCPDIIMIGTHLRSPTLGLLLQYANISLHALSVSKMWNLNRKWKLWGFFYPKINVFLPIFVRLVQFLGDHFELRALGQDIY